MTSQGGQAAGLRDIQEERGLRCEGGAVRAPAAPHHSLDARRVGGDPR